jgi:ribosomal protein S18 acetylase RimI-like enzyme
MEINDREVKAYELFVFFIRAMHAESYSKLRIAFLIPFLAFITLLNLILFSYPYRRLQKILDIRYIIDPADNGEKLGGYITVNKIKQNNYLYFGGFFVRPQYQGKGIGTIALLRLIQSYQSVNIRLDVDVDNARAIKLYKKLGFEEIEVDESQILMIHRPIVSEDEGV